MNFVEFYCEYVWPITHSYCIWHILSLRQSLFGCSVLSNMNNKYTADSSVNSTRNRSQSTIRQSLHDDPFALRQHRDGRAAVHRKECSLCTCFCLQCRGKILWEGMNANIRPWTTAPDFQCLSAIACTKNSRINDSETGRVGRNMNKLTDRQTYDLRVAVEPFV